MSDPNQPQRPSDAPAPPAPPSYPASPSYPAPPSYPASAEPAAGPAPSVPQPPAYPSSPSSYPQPSGPVPGRTLGIVAFALSFFLQLIALALGIVALVQSRRAGVANGFAVASIIISSVLLVVGIVIVVVLFAVVIGPILEICATYGPGEYVLENGLPLSCG